MNSESLTIDYATLESCHRADDMVVVIDVIRAFTTAAFAFAAGAQEIIPVATVEDAFALRDHFPGSLVMGEVGGQPPEGFDFGNSPVAIAKADLRGKRIIQRTSAGTQGLIRSVQAQTLLAGSFVCAGATVNYIKQQRPRRVTFVSTGNNPGVNEDDACAYYMAALLQGEALDSHLFLQQLRQSVPPEIFTDPDYAEFAADLDYCFIMDRFDFAMVVEQRRGLLVMEAVTSSS
jgi:2-phosphosulfolactate phosphatase